MKHFKYIIFCFILFLFFNVDCYAAPITYERTENDLKVPYRVYSLLNNDPELKNSILKTPAVDVSQKIYDFVDIFSESEELELKNELLEYKNKTGLDSVIVITDDLRDFSIESYGGKFYDYNDFTKDGIVFVIYIKDGKTKIYMGHSDEEDGRLNKVYNMGRINAILKYVYDHNISNKQYYDACKNYNILTTELYFKDVGNYTLDANGNITFEIPWLECIILSLSFAFIIFILFYTKYSFSSKRKNLTIKNSMDVNNMFVKCEYDKPLVEGND